MTSETKKRDPVDWLLDNWVDLIQYGSIGLVTLLSLYAIFTNLNVQTILIIAIFILLAFIVFLSLYIFSKLQEPIKLLKMRYAKGEINTAEFEERIEVLRRYVF